MEMQIRSIGNLLGLQRWRSQFHWESPWGVALERAFPLGIPCSVPGMCISIGSGLGVGAFIWNLLGEGGPGLGSSVGNVLEERAWSGHFHGESIWEVALCWALPLGNLLGEWPWSGHFHWESLWGAALASQCPPEFVWAQPLG